MTTADCEPLDRQIETACRAAADRIQHSRSVVTFTGAGISTESGIPDFRSPGGIWANSAPVLFQDFLVDPYARAEYWRQKASSHRDFAASQPNAGHSVLARWESSGRLRGVITQNIDELHQQAGSKQVLELHGTARKVACLDCDWRDDAGPWNERYLAALTRHESTAIEKTSQAKTSKKDAFNEERLDEGHAPGGDFPDDIVPHCPRCGGLIKHATVSFGQQLPPGVLMQASQWSRQADLFLAIGSSLVVEPASRLPRVACDHGACLIIINRDPTPLDERATIVIRHSIGAVLTAIDGLLPQSGSPHPS